MAIGNVESGTQSATTTHALGSGGTTAGVYVCSWNLTDMTNGEVVRCYATKEVLTSDTPEEVWSGWFSGVDGGGDPLVQSDPVVIFGGAIVQCHVHEEGANTVSVPWSLDRIVEF